MKWTIRSVTHRDRTGRIALEDRIEQPDEPAIVHRQILDFANGLRVVLIPEQRIAFRVHLPDRGVPKILFHDVLDGTESSNAHTWHTRTEDAGSRTIEGVEFVGVRLVTTAEDNPELTTTVVRWYSEKLKLNGAVERSGPYSSYTVHIEHLEFGEPDPAVFEIPPGYQIQDLDWNSLDCAATP